MNGDDVIRFQLIGEKGAAEDYTAFASRYGVSADMVKDYALGMETGNLQKANFAWLKYAVRCVWQTVA